MLIMETSSELPFQLGYVERSYTYRITMNYHVMDLLVLIIHFSGNEKFSIENMRFRDILFDSTF